MSEFSEQPKSPVNWEIRHFPNFDVILNTDAQIANPEGLVSKIGSGLDDWEEFAQHGDNKMFVDNPDSPNFIAKLRRFSTNEGKAFLAEGDVGFKTYGLIPQVRSLAHEIIISPKIKAALTSDEAGRIATQFGFDEIKFAEPLAGIIDKKTGLKHMIYEFVDGSVLNPADLQKPNTSFRREMKILLWKNGIEPFDLKDNCFITADVDGKKIAYLIDAERFYRHDIPVKPAA